MGHAVGYFHFTIVIEYMETGEELFFLEKEEKDISISIYIHIQDMEPQASFRATVSVLMCTILQLFSNSCAKDWKTQCQTQPLATFNPAWGGSIRLRQL